MVGRSVYNILDYSFRGIKKLATYEEDEIILSKDPQYGEMNATSENPITYNKVTNVNVFN